MLVLKNDSSDIGGSRRLGSGVFLFAGDILDREGSLRTKVAMA